MNSAPLRLYGQESTATTWAMANMHMIVHDMEGEIEIGDTLRHPKFRKGNRLQTFDLRGQSTPTNWLASRRVRAAVALDTGAASRGSGNANSNKERDVRRWFVELHRPLTEQDKTE